MLYVEPSLGQLAAMGREDPSSLAAVSNFTVGRRGMGQIRWLAPVDVRGLDLDGTVMLAKGTVEARLLNSHIVALLFYGALFWQSFVVAVRAAWPALS